MRTLISVSIIAGLLAASPVASAERAGCPRFAPAEPSSPASEKAEARDVEVIEVPRGATEANPLVVDYQHGPAFWELGHRVKEDEVFFNFQVPDGAKKGLHIRADYTNEYANELDLFLYDEKGKRVASSATFGLVGEQFSDPGHGGLGYDYIPGYRIQRCDGFTLESRALWSVGMDAKLSVWLGPIGNDIPNEDGQEG